MKILELEKNDIAIINEAIRLRTIEGITLSQGERGRLTDEEKSAYLRDQLIPAEPVLRKIGYYVKDLEWLLGDRPSEGIDWQAAAEWDMKYEELRGAGINLPEVRKID